MNLESGYNKIKSKSRRASNVFHYLRVFVENQNKYAQIDDGDPEEANDDMQILLESFTLIKKITHHNPVEVNNPVITISWSDEDSDPFVMKMRNIQTFKNALSLFPRIKESTEL